MANGVLVEYMFVFACMCDDLVNTSSIKSGVNTDRAIVEVDGAIVK